MHFESFVLTPFAAILDMTYYNKSNNESRMFSSIDFNNFTSFSNSVKMTGGSLLGRIKLFALTK